MEKLLHSAVVNATRTSYNNGNIIILKCFFNGRADLLLFGARALFEADHANDLALMDINKGTRLKKEMKKSRYDSPS